jgi:basic membrane protein A
VLISKSNGDYVPNLSTLAQQQYDVTVGVGFLMADAVATVAGKFPQNKFAIVDFPASGLKGKPQNVEGLLFKEQEAGYLAGYLAGLWAKDNNATTVSTVGGQKIPPVDHYIAGFQAGAKKANPGIKTLNAYSQDFVDQAKCKEIALDQIAQGSKVVFQVAGQCGLGALDAAKEKGVQGIGVDADQAYLGDHIMTSALKKVDQAVYDEIKAVQDNTFKGGDNTIFDVKSGGVGIGDTNEIGAKYADQVKEIQDKIASGELTDIPDTVK